MTKKANLFENTQSAPEIFKVKKSSKKERPVKEYDERLDQLAAVVTLIKSLKGVEEQLSSELDDFGFDLFAKDALALKTQPQNFIAQSELATADVQMQRKRSNQPLTDEKLIKELQAKEIPIEKDIKIPARFFLNAELLKDASIQEALSEAILKHPRLKGVAGDLIKRQDEEYHYIVTDETLSACAKKLAKEDYHRIVPMLSTMCIGKFQLDGAPIEEGRGEEKSVSENAKVVAIGLLQDMGVLPMGVSKRKKK